MCSWCCKKKKKDDYCDPCPQSSLCMKDVCDGGLAPRPSCVDDLKRGKHFKPPPADKPKTEKDYRALEKEFFALSSNLDKINFRLRQIYQARPSERDMLLCELALFVFGEPEEYSHCDNLPHMEKDRRILGNVKTRQKGLVKLVRGKMNTLDKKSVPGEPEKEDVKTKKKFLCF